MQDDPPEDDDLSDMLDDAPTTPPNMWGFLNISEAAVHLNITEDAVKQLVEERKLFAIRDTSGLKFKYLELERYIEDQSDLDNPEDTKISSFKCLERGWPYLPDDESTHSTMLLDDDDYGTEQQFFIRILNQFKRIFCRLLPSPEPYHFYGVLDTYNDGDSPLGRESEPPELRGVEWVQKDIKKDIQDFFLEGKNNPNAPTTPPNMYGEE